jgi:hypothetical protein
MKIGVCSDRTLFMCCIKKLKSTQQKLVSRR